MCPGKPADEHESLLTILDSFDAIIYVADMSTYELLYINKYTRDIFGDIVGKLCWQTIQQGQTGPCAFCTNDKLLDGKGAPLGTYVWEFQNTVNGKWYEVRDKAIEWEDGRLVRLEIATDISERKGAEAELVQSEERFRKIFEEGPLGMALVDLEKIQFVKVNERICKLLGYTAKELMQLTVPEVTSVDDIDKDLQLAQMLVANEVPYYSIEKRHVKKNNEVLWTHLTTSILRDEYNNPLYGLYMIQDISQFKENEKVIVQQNEFLENVIESLPYPFLVIDAASYGIVMANKHVGPKKMWKGRTCHQVTHHNDLPCTDKEHLCPLKSVIRHKRPEVTEHVHFDQQGEERFFEVHGYPIFNDEHEVVQMVEYSVDITDRKRLEKKLEEASLTDHLTGIYNRRGFMTMGGQHMKNAKRHKRGICLLYADLDNLKGINDENGHEVGDQALMETVAIFKECFRESDIIGRLGGDEFAVLMEGEKGSECSFYDTMRDRLEKKIVDANKQSGSIYTLALSIGVAKCAIEDVISIEDLLAQADRLMYENKKQKKKRLFS